MAAESGYSPEAAVAMLLFSIASSSLLLINKLCMHYFPIPAIISTLQFVCASTTAMVLMASGAVERDRWEWYKIKPYLYYVCMFVATIYANMRALQHSNVETIIVFRSACPLIVCVLDWAFLGRQLPSARSVGALLVILGGCVGYVLTDRAFKLNGMGAYTWVTAYFFIISVEMAYGKHIVGPHLKFASMWGPTLYTNTLSVPPMLTIGLLAHEADKIKNSVVTPVSICLLLSSCVIGVAISYLGWRARSLVTATCYTVLGVANKMFTVLANAMVWDQRASMTGILFLVVCLVGAAGYKQAPLAETPTEAASPGGKGTGGLLRGGRKQGVILAGLAICGMSAVMFSQASGSGSAPPSLVPIVPPSAAPYTVAPLPDLGADDRPFSVEADAHSRHTHHAHAHDRNHTHKSTVGLRSAVSKASGKSLGAKHDGSGGSANKASGRGLGVRSSARGGRGMHLRREHPAPTVSEQAAPSA